MAGHNLLRLGPGEIMSIQSFLSICRQILGATCGMMLVAGEEDPGVCIKYVRRKVGRGFEIVYEVCKRTGEAGRWITMTVGEAALNGAGVWLPALATSFDMRSFPADAGMPALAACCNPVPDGPVFQALEQAARIQLGSFNWRLSSAAAEVVRYKPGNRCVIRYDLLLKKKGAGSGTTCQVLTLFGKLYSDPEQARTIQAVMRQLYAERAEADGLLIPRPLGVEKSMGLSLCEAVLPPAGAAAGAVKTGLVALHPRTPEGTNGGSRAIVPAEELSLAANWLARLHTSSVQPVGAPRNSARDAEQLRERAELIASFYPEQAEVTWSLGDKLAGLLETLDPGGYCPSHGAYKASQLLYQSGRVYVVDLDGFSFADPARDVGYFLAYLHPSGLWYGHPGLEEWYAEAAAEFVSAYRRALRRRGVGDARAKSIVERSRLYEAALLFKIAARRSNRLNSPRPGELCAMLEEIRALLGNAATVEIGIVADNAGGRPRQPLAA